MKALFVIISYIKSIELGTRLMVYLTPINRKVLTLTLVLFSMLGFTEESHAQSRRTTLYVDASYTGSTASDGSISSPFKTIRGALDYRSWVQGNAGMVSDEEIVVRPGTYSPDVSEMIFITRHSGGKDNYWLTLRAEGNVYIDGANLYNKKFAALIAVSDGSRNVRVKGFKLKNVRNNQSLASYVKGVFVKDTKFGIQVSNTVENVEIVENEIYDFSWTLDVSPMKNSLNFTPNEIAILKTAQGGDNTGAINVTGTHTTPIRNVVIKNNYIHNVIPGWTEAIQVNGNVDGFEVSNNTINEVQNIGIVAAGHYGWVLNIEGAIVTADLNYARNGVIRNNKVTSCKSPIAAAAGIYCDGSRNVLIENNIVSDGQVGFSIGNENSNVNSGGHTVKNNIAYNNAWVGLVLGTAPHASGSYIDNVTVSGNTFFRNGNITDTYLGSMGGAEIVVQKNIKNLSVKNNIVYAANHNTLVAFTMPFDAAMASFVNTISFDYNLYYTNSTEATPLGVFDWSQFGPGYDYYGTFDWYRVQRADQDVHSKFANPKFLNSTSSVLDARLLVDSPAINAGDPNYVPTYGETGFYGNARIRKTIIDIGAYESNILPLGSPLITVQPNSKETFVGSDVEFSVTATGSGLTYQWYKDTIEGPKPIQGSTSNKLNIAEVELEKDEGSYYVQISNGGQKIRSDLVRLHVIFITPKSVGSCGDWGFHPEKSLITDRFAKAVWTYGGGEDKTVKYRVYLKDKETGGPNPQFVLKMEFSSTSSFPEYTFDNLIADKEYEVEIKRLCNTQWSSKRTVFRTEKDPTVDVPKNKDCISNWQNNGITQTGSAESSVKFKWPSAGKSAFYKVEYRPSALSEPWILVKDNIKITETTISELPTSTFNTEYKVRVTRMCLNNPSISIVGVVQTKKAGILDCTGFWNIKSTYGASENAIALYWPEIGGATYEVWYREGSTSDCYKRFGANFTGKGATVTGLKESTSYDFVVIKKCPNYTYDKTSVCPPDEDFVTGPDVSKVSFRTTGRIIGVAKCGSPIGLRETNLTPNSVVLTYDDAYPIATNTSENISLVLQKVIGISAYGGNLSPSCLEPNTTYTYTFHKTCVSSFDGKSMTAPPITKQFTTPQFSNCPVPTGLGFNGPLSHYYNFIDWDQICGVPSYTVAVKKTGTEGWSYFNTTENAFVKEGEWETNYTFKVKANCSDIGGDNWSNELSFTTASACPKALSFRVVNVVPTGFELEWDEAVSMTADYVLQVNENNQGWSGDMRQERRGYFAYLTDKSDTMFQFRIRPDCPEGASTNWVYTEPIRSLVDPTACSKPWGLRLVFANSNNGKVEWNEVPGAASYTLAASANDGDWEFFDTTATSYESALLPNTTYRVAVRSNCIINASSDFNDYEMLNFTTPSTLSLKASLGPVSDNIVLEESIVYPNNNQGNFKIRFKNTGKNVKAVTIFDITGSKVFHKSYDGALVEETYNLGGKLSSGVYKIHIRTQNDIEYKTIVVTK